MRSKMKVLSNESFKQVMKECSKKANPTKELKNLMGRKKK